MRSRLPLASLLLLAVASAGGCAGSGPKGELTKEERLTSDVDWYTVTVAGLSGLRAAGVLDDDAYRVADAARAEARRWLDARRVAIANDSPDMPGSDYRAAVNAFAAAMAELVRIKIDGQKVKAAVERARVPLPTGPPAVVPPGAQPPGASDDVPIQPDATDQP